LHYLATGNILAGSRTRTG